MPKDKVYYTDYRAVLEKALEAHLTMIRTDYDRGFHEGLYHALYLLNKQINAINICHSYIENSDKPQYTTRRKVSIIISRRRRK